MTTANGTTSTRVTCAYPFSSYSKACRYEGNAKALLYVSLPSAKLVTAKLSERRRPGGALAGGRRSILAVTLLRWICGFEGSPSSAVAQGAPALERTQPPPPLGRVLELLKQAEEAWGIGLDPRLSDQRADQLDLACRIFDQIVAIDPQDTEWLEARGQVRIDAKRFKEALDDFREVIHRNPNNFKAYAGRALAHEGLAEWEDAVEDYTMALEKEKTITGYMEPYVINSRGNAFASLGRYSDALQDYQASIKGFQKAKELDGAIYAASNAALMWIQLGDETKGFQELSAVARRAPSSIDARAALTALYWSQGKEQAAEEEWEFTCENINTGQSYDGCVLYKDRKWLEQIRRWPPVMVQRMSDFLHLK